MKLAINYSGMTRIFYDTKGHPIQVDPNAVVTTDLLRGADSVLRPISSFLGEMFQLDASRYYLRRQYSLGDVLMIAPVIRHLRKMGLDAIMRTSIKYLQIFNGLQIPTEVIERKLDFSVPGIILDGTVERDHEIPRWHKKHRVHIYMEVLGLKERPREVDWSCDLKRFGDPPGDFFNKPYFVFQWAGSTYKKQLPEKTASYLIKKMTNEGMRIAVLGKLPKTVKENEAVSIISHQANMAHLFPIIGKAQFLITMDSAPLWISHFVKVPTIALLGPSRPQERLSLHPLYPKHANAIQLNKEIGCPACFEQAKACSDSMKCLKLEPQRLYELINMMLPIL
jgi:ADP-heptose:LPS heptosyltransferase